MGKPSPRFKAERRPGSFVDREEARSRLQVLLSSDAHECLINVTGVGGIGKSRLCHEVARSEGDSRLVVTVDFEAASSRDPMGLALHLRSELKRKGANTADLDIGIAAMWQRANPHLAMNKQTLPFIEQSDVLIDVVNSLGDAPLVGTAYNLIKLSLNLQQSASRKWRITRTEELQRLDELSMSDLGLLLAYLLARVLDEESSKRSLPSVVVMDSYEALDPKLPSRQLREFEVWLREFIAQLERTKVLVASREPLSWIDVDPDWASVISEVSLDPLPREACEELLMEAGYSKEQLEGPLIQASEGLPFYLHLAIDNNAQSPNELSSATHTAVLDRFLAHVDPDTERVLFGISRLRLLSDESALQLLIVMEVPEPKRVWEQVRSYSFVTDSSQGTYAFHRLMSAELETRFGHKRAHTAAEYALETWTRLESVATTPQDKAVRCRERLFHAAELGRLSEKDLLEAADEMLRVGQAEILENVLGDLALAELKRSSPDNLGHAKTLLKAELLLAQGGADAAQDLISLLLKVAPIDDGLVSRRAVFLGAHCLRIRGETPLALDSYRSLTSGKSIDLLAIRAGIWSADLLMASGDFMEAARGLAQVLDSLDSLEDSPKAVAAARGDALRTLHLLYRWSMHPDESLRALSEAREAYVDAESVVGLAMLECNSVEMICWTDPEACLEAVPKVIERHEYLGSRVEIGKAQLSAGIALLLSGRFDDAHSAMQDSVGTLTEADYRSGVARASLFLAYCHFRMGHIPDCEGFLQRSAEELQSTHVYPTLILLGGHLADHIGVDWPFATDAKQRIRPLDGDETLMSRVRELHVRLSGVD